MHSLTYLVELVAAGAAGFEAFREEVARLDPFAVDERYPRRREGPPLDVAEELFDIAQRVVAAVRAALP